MKIHMIGIAGVGMGNLASLLKQLGHTVSGSDSGVYFPMNEFLGKWWSMKTIFFKGICNEDRRPAADAYKTDLFSPWPFHELQGNQDIRDLIQRVHPDDLQLPGQGIPNYFTAGH